MRILIADDDKVITQLLSHRMRKEGHEVFVAYDAMQAMMFALQELPDLLILDINMPGGTGAEVVRRLKSCTKTNRIPILVLSSSSDLNEQRVFVSAGAIGFMAKQTGLHRLEKTVAAVLHMNKSGRAADQKRPPNSQKGKR